MPVVASAKFNLYPWQLEENWASIFDQEENVRRETEKNNFEVLDETDPGSILNGDTLIHTQH